MIDAPLPRAANAEPFRAISWRVPWTAVLVAALAAVLHLGPHFVAKAKTPDGHSFTGVISGSPDTMQYRLLAKETRASGMLVDNPCAVERSDPHIAMVFYAGLGVLADATGVPDPVMWAYAGALWAFLLTLLIFITVRHFVRTPYATWWVFVVILIGGGLGAHLRILERLDFVRDSFLFQRLLLQGLEEAILFEDYRDHYVLYTLFDAHFAFFWLVTLASILSLYETVQRFSVLRLAVTALLFALTSVLHVYEGVTLSAIAGGVALLAWRKRIATKPALAAFVVCSLAALIPVIWQVLLYKWADATVPSFRSPPVQFSELLLAYPLAWGLMAWGLATYWRKGSLDAVFLLGWIVGCIALTLSGPFYPYPDRGTITLQIPACIVAGIIYFSRYKRVSWVGALIVLAVIGPGIPWQLKKIKDMVLPHNERPYMYQSRDHLEILDALREDAGDRDILIVDKAEKGWRTSDLWLAAPFPGRLYCSHYALTPDHESKRAELATFYEGTDPVQQAAFLRERSIDFVYLSPDVNVDDFERIDGVTVRVMNGAGTLLAVSRP